MAYKKSKETKKALVDTAKKLFSEKGFNKTSMREIAKEVGITHPLAYYYFKGKHDIANEILDNHFYTLSKIFNNYMKPNDDTLLFLLVLIKFVFREVCQNQKDLNFYIEAYRNNYSTTHETDNILIEYTLLIAKELNLPLDYDHAYLSIVLSGSVWNQLYYEKLEKGKEISEKEIRDTTDLIRWTYIGLDRNFVLEKIEQSYTMLDKIPIQNIPLLDR